ncbi:hypothetical protein NDU88_004407 [Pleurodeles waltl]|uniref:Uncharacterized protein n=1 Tax=Pleurodeles waltl TaxID=8319 RepID=A0AAV7QC73_PLEWA|nr:hypothetical protein NDU88_004407 [Pleurodeles waltl]
MDRPHITLVMRRHVATVPATSDCRVRCCERLQFTSAEQAGRPARGGLAMPGCMWPTTPVHRPRCNTRCHPVPAATRRDSASNPVRCVEEACMMMKRKAQQAGSGSGASWQRDLAVWPRPMPVCNVHHSILALEDPVHELEPLFLPQAFTKQGH